MGLTSMMPLPLLTALQTGVATGADTVGFENSVDTFSDTETRALLASDQDVFVPPQDLAVTTFTANLPTLSETDPATDLTFPTPTVPWGYAAASMLAVMGLNRRFEGRSINATTVEIMTGDRTFDLSPYSFARSRMDAAIAWEIFNKGGSLAGVVFEKGSFSFVDIGSIEEYKDRPDFDDGVYVGFAGADFSGADLRLADLSKISLKSCDLRGARLPLDVAHWPQDFSGVRLDREQVMEIICQGRSLAGADLRGVDLSGLVLRNVDLTGADLSGADLSRADLRGASLTSADLRAARLDEADLRNAHLECALLGSASLKNAKLSEAHCDKADFSAANLAEADLRLSYLLGAQFTRAVLDHAKVNGASIAQANFDSARLAGLEGYDTLFGFELTSWRDVELPSPDFLLGHTLPEDKAHWPELDGAQLSGKQVLQLLAQGVSLRGITIDAADFSGQNLSGANFRGVNFTKDTRTLFGGRAKISFAGANLESADFVGVNFENVDLTGANFIGANLADANISEAKVTGANFAYANLMGAAVNGGKGNNFFGAEIEMSQKHWLESNGASFTMDQHQPQFLPLVLDTDDDSPK